MSELKVMPIDPERLAKMRRTGADEHGNEWAPFSARGWEPLRCCLSLALEGVPIVLISYQPLDGPSPWAEVGPVFVHAHACDGYRTPDALPAALAVGPRLLRTYHADGRSTTTTSASSATANPSNPCSATCSTPRTWPSYTLGPWPPSASRTPCIEAEATEPLAA